MNLRPQDDNQDLGNLQLNYSCNQAQVHQTYPLSSNHQNCSDSVGPRKCSNNNDFIDLIDMIGDTHEMKKIGRPASISTPAAQQPKPKPQPKLKITEKSVSKEKVAKLMKPKGQRGRPRKIVDESASTVKQGKGRGRGIRSGESKQTSGKKEVSKIMDLSDSEGGQAKNRQTHSIEKHNKHKRDQGPSNESFTAQPVKPIDKEKLDQFTKLNQATIAWQEGQQMSKLKTYDHTPTKHELIVSCTNIHPSIQVCLVECNWLQKARDYISKVSKIKHEQLAYQENIQKSQKVKNTKKKGDKTNHKSKEDNFVKMLADAASEFSQSCRPLSNQTLIQAHQGSSACYDYPFEHFNFYFSTKDFKGYQVVLRPQIEFQEHYEIIQPQLNEFLTDAKNREMFNVHKSEFAPIFRKYRRLDDRFALKTELDLQYIKTAVRYGSHKMIVQLQVDMTIKQVINRIKKLLSEISSEPKDNLMVYLILDSQLYELRSEFIDFKTLFRDNLEDSDQFVEIRVVSKQDSFDDDVKQIQTFHLKCNYCKKRINGSRRQVACHCNQVSYCNDQCSQLDIPYHKPQCNKQISTMDDWKFDRLDQNVLSVQSLNRQGLVGLQNMTNSCYLNCTLQCLSQCKALTNYFLRGLFISELNRTNTLGQQGLFAIGYAQIIKQLWSGESPTIIPINFKNVLARFKKQFSNNDQQDSQELLTIILDSLHEDLNRVKIKPLVPTIESHGENDKKASLESWEAHLKRSQSVIVDLMHGQFKSTVRCPESECNHLSITFEPFMNITLPIPEIKMISKHFIWVPSDINEKCSVHKFTIKGHESILNLRKFVTSEILHKQGICDDENGFEIVLINQDKIKRILCHQNQALSLQGNTTHVFIYQVTNHQDQQKQTSELESKLNVVQKVMMKEILSRVDESTIMTVVNFEIVNFGFSFDQQNHSRPTRVCQSSSEDLNIVDTETYFPRLMYLKLDNSLIQIHLHIFEKLKFIFSRFLELREWYLHEYQSNLPASSSIEDSLFFPKNSMKIPLHLSIEKWNRMSLTEQYEVVFSCHSNFKDPSRMKPQDLPYFIRLVSRKTSQSQRTAHISSSDGEVEQSRDSNATVKSNQSKRANDSNPTCIYCHRKTCNGCPLPFDDKTTLRNFLTRCKAPMVSSSFYMEDDTYNQKQKQQVKKTQNSKEVKDKSPTKSKGKKSQPPMEDCLTIEDENLDLQLVIQFNRNNCWGLHELLVRGQNQKMTFVNSIMKLKQAKKRNEKKTDEVIDDTTQFIDKVTIADCFRQFDRPEKLSWQNEWYCDQCKQHKQAYKKIQVYKTPPILIITLKRFKGNLTNQKQNTPVYYPIEGLNMKNFIISQDQMTSELDQMYDLFAVSLHTGTLNGGHYTAVAKNNDQWYEFNDHQVIKIAKHETSKIISNHAYILFYQKRGIDFENILDYNQIKNELISQTAGGKEKFDPTSIIFPKQIESKNTEVPKMVLCEGHNQLDIFDIDHDFDSKSFVEVHHEEKKNYIDWLASQLNIDECIFENISDLSKDQVVQPQLMEQPMLEICEAPVNQTSGSDSSSQESIQPRKRELKRLQKLILSDKHLGLNKTTLIQLDKQVITRFKKQQIQNYKNQKQLVSKIIKTNRDSLNNKGKKNFTFKLNFDKFLQNHKPHPGKQSKKPTDKANQVPTVRKIKLDSMGQVILPKKRGRPKASKMSPELQPQAKDQRTSDMQLFAVQKDQTSNRQEVSSPITCMVSPRAISPLRLIPKFTDCEMLDRQSSKQSPDKPSMKASSSMLKCKEELSMNKQVTQLLNDIKSDKISLNDLVNKTEHLNDDFISVDDHDMDDTGYQPLKQDHYENPRNLCNTSHDLINNYVKNIIEPSSPSDLADNYNHDQSNTIDYWVCLPNIDAKFEKVNSEQERAWEEHIRQSKLKEVKKYWYSRQKDMRQQPPSD